jgi:hypothetical protein
MKKFMISFTHTKAREMSERVPRWAELSDEEKQAVGRHVKDLAKTLQEEYNTAMVFFDDPRNARTVRLDRDGNLTEEKGPLLKDDEFVGGYFTIDAESMDEALDLARRARWLIGSNEVREIGDINLGT